MKISSIVCALASVAAISSTLSAAAYDEKSSPTQHPEVTSVPPTIERPNMMRRRLQAELQEITLDEYEARLWEVEKRNLKYDNGDDEYEYIEPNDIPETQFAAVRRRMAAYTNDPDANYLERMSEHTDDGLSEFDAHSPHRRRALDEIGVDYYTDYDDDRWVYNGADTYSPRLQGLDEIELGYNSDEVEDRWMNARHPNHRALEEIGSDYDGDDDNDRWMHDGSEPPSPHRRALEEIAQSDYGYDDNDRWMYDGSEPPSPHRRALEEIAQAYDGDDDDDSWINDGATEQELAAAQERHRHLMSEEDERNSEMAVHVRRLMAQPDAFGPIDDNPESNVDKGQIMDVALNAAMEATVRSSGLNEEETKYLALEVEKITAQLANASPEERVKMFHELEKATKEALGREGANFDIGAIQAVAEQALADEYVAPEDMEGVASPSLQLVDYVQKVKDQLKTALTPEERQQRMAELFPQVEKALMATGITLDEFKQKVLEALDEAANTQDHQKPMAIAVDQELPLTQEVGADQAQAEPAASSLRTSSNTPTTSSATSNAGTPIVSNPVTTSTRKLRASATPEGAAVQPSVVEEAQAIDIANEVDEGFSGFLI